MPAYRLTYTNGSNSLTPSKLLAESLDEAVASASLRAERVRLTAPAVDWSKWEMQITDEAEGMHRFPFPCPR